MKKKNLNCAGRIGTGNHMHAGVKKDETRPPNVGGGFHGI